MNFQSEIIGIVGFRQILKLRKSLDGKIKDLLVILQTDFAFRYDKISLFKDIQNFSFLLKIPDQDLIITWRSPEAPA